MITVVVGLMGVLVTFLSGLTAGLAHQNVSAVQALPGVHLVFADTGAPASFDRSQLTAAQVAAATATDPSAVPVGVGRATLARSGHAPLPVAVFGIPAGATPDAVQQSGSTIRLSSAAARGLDAAAGDKVAIGGQQFTVAAPTGDRWYSHTPVVYVSLADWQSLNPQAGAATVVITSSSAAPNGTLSVARGDALAAIGSYDSEHRSLQLMTTMLFAISALVVGSFFVVWTMQRIGDIAALKALGARTRTLVLDALSQAAAVLVIGVGAGATLAATAGALLGDQVPFVSSASTTLLPAVLLIGLGMAGSVAALRFLVTADPLTALNGGH